MKFYRKTRAKGDAIAAKQILLERQGSVWEGNSQKKLPTRIAQWEEEISEPEMGRQQKFVYAKRLLAVILGLNVKP